MIKITFKEIRQFNIATEAFFKRASTNENTLIGFAIKKISNAKPMKSIMRQYREDFSELSYEEVERKQVEHALVDKDSQAVLTAPKGSPRPYLYDSKGLLEVMKAEKDFQKKADDLLELWDAKEFTIKEYLSSSAPEDLTPSEIKGFRKFVLDGAKANEMLIKLGLTLEDVDMEAGMADDTAPASPETPSNEKIEPAA